MNSSKYAAFNSLMLRVMEAVECDLACSGCYLKAESSKPNWPASNLEKVIKHSNISSLTTALYINNLDKPVEPVIAQFEERITQLKLKHISTVKRYIITDSITLMERFPFMLPTDYRFLISPRNVGSVKQAHEKLRKNGKDVQFIYTVGVDSSKVFETIMSLDIDALHLNVRKPSDPLTYLGYMNIRENLTNISNSGSFALFTDACHELIANKVNCHDPQRGMLELTTYLDEQDYYTCSYPSSKCIADSPYIPENTNASSIKES